MPPTISAGTTPAAPSLSTSVVPDAIRTTPSAPRRNACGALTDSLVPMITPGHGAEQDVAGEAEVDVAADPVRRARGPEEDGRVKDVRADHPLRSEPEDRDQRDRDQRAAAGGGQADHEAGDDSRDDRRDDVAAVEVHRASLLDHVLEEERPQKRREADDQERAAEHAEHQFLEPFLAVLALEDLDHPDAEERRRHGPHGHPERDSEVDRLQLEVLEAADGLGDRRVEDVGADRGDRGDVEDQDEERRHQGCAAHAGHADEHANAEAECDDCWIHEGGALSSFPDRLRSKAACEG